MQLFKLEPTKVIVKEGLDRFRKDAGELLKLAESIKKFGQLQAIVLNRQNELICGGRRLAACTVLNIPVLCMYQDTVDPVMMREMELEENLQRKDFTPAEEVLAVTEIHRLKQELYGTAIPGQQDSGWTLDKTAAAIGKTRGNVIESLQLAEMVAMFPELKDAKTKKEIKRTAKALDKVKVAIEALSKYKLNCDNNDKLFSVFHMEATAFLCDQPNNKYHTFLTDPPYGINIHDTMMGLGGHTGGENSSGIKFDDSKEAMDLGIAVLAKELFRITTYDAQGYVFVAPEHFYPTRSIFVAAGWAAYIKPMIWIKNSSGQANQPSMYPGSCYETILFLRKSDARLVAEGRPDWMQFTHIIGSSKLHPNEKPVDLLMELLDRISLPGMFLIDPFMGSGSAIEAAVRKKLYATGCDKLLECYATTLARMEGVK